MELICSMPQIRSALRSAMRSAIRSAMRYQNDARSGAVRRRTNERLHPLRTIQSPNNSRTRDERGQDALHVRKILYADEFARFVETDQIAHPRERRDVRDRILIAENPLAPFETLLQHAEQPFRFGDVAIARTLVFVFLACEFMEEAKLAEHRADAAHLKHDPLNRLVAAGGVLWNQLAGFVCE